jgi:stress-induced-phosphoprotein 1
MSNREQALIHKGKGNEAFKAGDFETSITEFNKAIENDPTDHVFYSNLSGSYASLGRYQEALDAAEKCVETKPDWAKGFTRKGLALFNLKKFDEAKGAYEQGKKLAPDNDSFTQGIANCEREKANAANPLGQLFGPSMWPKLMTNPMTRDYLNDEAFVNKMKMLQGNPSLISQFQSDPKVTTAISVILGLGGGPGGGAPGGPRDVPAEADEEEADIEVSSAGVKTNAKKAPEPAKPAPKKELTEEEKQEKKNKEEAQAEKAKGNAFYKKRQFKEALEHYQKAIELQPNDVVYRSNLAAVQFEQKEYDTCIETCKEALKIGAEHRSSFKLLAKLYGRIGNAYMRKDDLAEAIVNFKASLMEDSNDKIKINLKKAEEKQRKQAKAAYLNPEKALEDKAKGNEFYKAGKWQDAIEQYTESIKRDPTNHAVYSNRAACFAKLMSWNQALEDCETCLGMEPTFVKAYIRKGKVQHFLKQYHKALVTFDQGLALDPNCTDLIQAKQLTVRVINQSNSTGAADPERQREAMKDPEIQAILRDPVINNVLQTMQTEPAKAQDMLKDPTIMGKIEKLVAAGILQVK